jgi:hypothetical protein
MDSQMDSHGEGAIRVESRAADVDDAMRFLREMRKLRNSAGLKPAELAARAHYPRDVIVAAEAGPSLPDLPVLSAYVRGCGAAQAEWEERWRSLTRAPASGPCLPARPVGCSALAEAGARLFTGLRGDATVLVPAPLSRSLAGSAAVAEVPGSGALPGARPGAALAVRPGAALPAKRQSGFPRAALAATALAAVMTIVATIVVLLRRRR